MGHFTGGEAASFDRCASLLRRMTVFAYGGEVVDNCYLVPHLKLYRLRCLVEGRVVYHCWLLVAWLLNPIWPVFLPCRPYGGVDLADLRPGIVVEPDLGHGWSNLLRPAAARRLLMEAGGGRVDVDYIFYKVAGLLELAITGLEDVTARLFERQHREPDDPVVKLLLRKHRRGSNTGAAERQEKKPRPGRKGHKDREGQGPGGAAAAEAELEANLAKGPSATDAEEVAADSEVDKGGVEQHEAGPGTAPGPLSSAASSGQAPAARGAAVSSAAEVPKNTGLLGAEAEATVVEETRLLDDMPDDEAPAEVRRILAEQRQLPRLAPGSNQVVDPESGRIIGRMSLLNKGHPSEKVSVYCRLHQCYPPPIRARVAPTGEQVMEWFHAGLHEVPQGQAGKAAHTKMFRDMCASCRL